MAEQLTLPEHPKLNEGYVVVTGDDEDAARDAFVARYGEHPEIICHNFGDTYAGPVPNRYDLS
jgi:hypothetical protein